MSLGQMAKSMEGSPCWMELSPASHVHNMLEATPALHLATDRPIVKSPVLLSESCPRCPDAK